jgi:hypothetical protein
MATTSFRAAAPSLALGLFLVSQALGRPQPPHSGLPHPKPTSGATLDPSQATNRGEIHALSQSGTASSSTISTNQNIVNAILKDEKLAIGRNDQLLDRQSWHNQSIYALSKKTPTSPAMARIIAAQMKQQTEMFYRIQHHLDLNKLHIGNRLPPYDAQVAKSLAALQVVAPGHPALVAYIVDAMRLQMKLSNRLKDIQSLPPATPFTPSP